MRNRDVEAAWRYHDATKHSYLSVREGGHSLDWPNQPRPFKIYENLPAIPLPRWVDPGMPALAAIANDEGGAAAPSLPTLAYLLHCAAGITKRRQYPGGELAFRAASCTGALYEIELYLVCRDLHDLPAGVYHFGPADFALRELRRGDVRRRLVDATGDAPGVAAAPAAIVCTATYWRNAWKYRARTYRHFGWDNGTILANLIAASQAAGLSAGVVCGFVDAAVNELLALDAEKEVAFSIVPVGREEGRIPPPPPITPLQLRTVPLSRSEVDYPIMREMHGASSLVSADEVREWRDMAATGTNGRRAAAGGRRIPLDIRSGAELPADSLEQVVARRGSARRFDRHAAWTFSELSTALHGAAARLSADFLGTLGRGREGGASPPLLNDLYIIVHAVDGLAPGAYVLHRGASPPAKSFELELLKEGRFREQAGYLGLEQDLPADASAVVFFLADLHATLAARGNRGYRAAQLEAGILSGRLYLAAYAQRLAASGLTFYDDDVVEFFSPHADGKSAIFCMTLGKTPRNLQGRES